MDSAWTRIMSKEVHIQQSLWVRSMTSFMTYNFSPLVITCPTLSVVSGKVESSEINPTCQLFFGYSRGNTVWYGTDTQRYSIQLCLQYVHNIVTQASVCRTDRHCSGVLLFKNVTNIFHNSSASSHSVDLKFLLLCGLGLSSAACLQTGSFPSPATQGFPLDHNHCSACAGQ